VPTYDELILVARRATLAKQGDKIRRFVQALGRGYARARRDPSAAVAALVRANPDLKTKLQLASVKASLPAFTPPAGKPFGWQDPAAWRAYGLWMQRNKLLKHPANAQDALTNEFLAGQGI
jgi:putative hydroxymethylpyrimidine transport system substrate-binding protein